ncbi:MAG TPA: condensation domain-containing protein [Jatrophihabitans sp.]|nr:condensation domain-containing protein [Jatrophihabitans sp.]
MDEQGGIRTVTVRFEAAGSGEESLTWAQNDVWQGMVATGKATTLGGVHPMPPGTTVSEIADLLRFIMSRHQALRTRLRLTDGPPRQVCSATGEAALEIVEAGTDEPAAVAENLKLRLEEQPFDYEQDWPVRMAVVTVRGAITHLVTVYLHLAVDGGGIAAVVADVAARDPRTGAPAGPITAIQPLELARRQAQPAALRQSAASLRHLEHVLRVVSPNMLGLPKADRPAEYRKIRYTSPATALAVERIAGAHSIAPSSALLAMFALGLARHTQEGTVWTMVLVNNRFRPGLADSACQLVQSSPCLIEVGGVSLATVLERTKRSLLQTYKSAYYDGRQFDAVVERVNRETGRKVDFCCYYNDRLDGLAAAGDAALTGPEEPAGDDPLTGAERLTSALGLASWSEEHEHALPAVPMFFNVDHPPGALDFQVSFDTRYLEVEDMIAVVRGIEAAAVETALTPDAPTRVPLRAGQPA